jgi:transcriptional regulator with XRE-family HTH domain
MVMLISNQSAFTPARHQLYARLFGRCIEKIRESKCQSLEETATLAGMESSEWVAIEAGHVPDDAAQLQSMAGALECHYDEIVNLALVCKGAWGL